MLEWARQKLFVTKTGKHVTAHLLSFVSVSMTTGLGIQSTDFQRASQIFYSVCSVSKNPNSYREQWMAKLVLISPIGFGRYETLSSTSGLSIEQTCLEARTRRLITRTCLNNATARSVLLSLPLPSRPRFKSYRGHKTKWHILMRQFLVSQCNLTARRTNEPVKFRSPWTERVPTFTGCEPWGSIQVNVKHWTT